METKNQLSFGYGNQKIKLLEWEVKTPFGSDQSLYWEPEFDIFIEEKDANGNYTFTIDAGLYLRINKDNYVFMIKTRNVFIVNYTNEDLFRNSVISMMMDNAVAHTRAMCLDKNREENLVLPLIPYFNPKKLFEYAELRMFSPALSEFSYERRKQLKKHSAIVGSMTIGIEEYRNYILDFEPKPITHPDSVIAGLTHKEGEMIGGVSFNYDYEFSKENDWKIHIDYSLQVLPVAAIKIRTSFMVHGSASEVFSMPVFNVMVEEAIKHCSDSFLEQCKLHNIDFAATIPPSPELIEMHSSGAIQQYNEYRKFDDISNAQSREEIQTMTFGGNTLLIVKATFMILDEVLIRNPSFDHKHNWEAIQVCPIMESPYYTLKANYLEIEKGEIQVTMLNFILFYLCLDIALQLLLSHHSDTLQDAFLKYNFIPLRQEEYIKFGNAFYDSVNKSLKESGASIGNFEKPRDWASMIR